MRNFTDDPVELQRRREFVAACNRAYHELRCDPQAWAEELAERAEWDCTLLDGLNDDES